METPLFERQQPTLQEVKLADIEPWSTSGAKSATGKAIAALGFNSTVLLRPLPRGQRYRYSVVDGARRLDNAREQSLETVPTMVLGADVTQVEVAALKATMNLARRPNLMQEAEALEALLDDCQATGIPEDKLVSFIAQTLGLSSSVVKQRLNLLTLPTILGHGVKMGKVARGVAAKIANLPQAQQEQLTSKYLEKGKLTANDVQDVRRVKQEATLAELPENLFAAITDDPGERAKTLLKDFMNEGLSAERLVALVEEVRDERKVF